MKEDVIFRAFEYQGKRYIHGYGARFDTPDSHGTMMTRQVVEASLDVLRKFPAMRYMHQKPFAQILFNREIEGIKTHVDNVGFYILAEVYPEAETEWNMVKKGGWGLSWSMAPQGAKTQVRQAADGNYYPHFVAGLIREISVVDAPSHIECVATTIERSLNNNPPPKTYTMQNFETYEVNPDSTLSIPEKPEEPKAPPQPSAPPTRNTEAQNTSTRHSSMRADGKLVGEKGFLNRSEE
jgi:hypothetical protein